MDSNFGSGKNHQINFNELNFEFEKQLAGNFSKGSNKELKMIINPCNLDNIKFQVWTGETYQLKRELKAQFGKNELQLAINYYNLLP